jgi:hypothetical protein
MNLIPDAKAAKKCGVCKKTLGRWDDKPELGFPPIIWINGRKFRDADLLDAFFVARVRASSMERPKPRAKRKQLKQFAAEAV